MSVASRYSVARASEYRAFDTMARMSASVNRDTMRAAQNASSARMLSNAGLGYSGRQLSGIERLRLEAADGGRHIGIVDVKPVASVEAERRQRQPARRPIEDVFIAGAVTLRRTRCRCP